MAEHIQPSIPDDDGELLREFVKAHAAGELDPSDCNVCDGCGREVQLGELAYRLELVEITADRMPASLGLVSPWALACCPECVRTLAQMRIDTDAARNAGEEER